MKNFVLIGAAGYIAPRHMKAIRETGNNLVAALDPHDAVGVLDQYFPDCDFFTEFERFDRHCEKLKRQGTSIDYVVVCSPNYLHDAHIRFGLRIGADVICEKPVVINPWNLNALIAIEQETGRRVHIVHQLRYHPEIMRLKKIAEEGKVGKMYQVDLTYITPRGKWYKYSWKGDEDKSGGLISNIGVHIFDLLVWIFGAIKESVLTESTDTMKSGNLVFMNATVNWMLGIDYEIPPSTDLSQLPLRRMKVNDEVIDFSKTEIDLHTRFYDQVVMGSTFRLTELKPLYNLLHSLRTETLFKS